MTAITKLNSRDLDFYPTPRFATSKLIEILNPSGVILEPCSGQGDMTNVLKDSGLTVITNDIDSSCIADFHLDATIESNWSKFGAIDFTISNFPFNLASTILPIAFDYSMKGIAILLRNSFTEPTFDRQAWLQSHQEYLSDIIFLPRISFTGDNKTDSVSCNFYVWTKEKTDGCQLHWVLKSKKSRIAKSKIL